MRYKTILSGLHPKEVIADVIRRNSSTAFQSEITRLARTEEEIRFHIEVWHREYDLYTWRETAMFDRPVAGQYPCISNAIVTLRDWRITHWASPDKAGQLGCEITIEHVENDVCARTVSKALQKLLAPGQLIVDPTDAYWDQHWP
ncbi:MAG: hypothetical protein FJ011_24115 [Chloroflexi bacterium]|nr:hypothetical protein [Chloroflexota bacterium]